MILYYSRGQEEFSITRNCITHGLYSFYGVVHNAIEMAVSKAVDKEHVEGSQLEQCYKCDRRCCLSSGRF